MTPPAIVVLTWMRNDAVGLRRFLEVSSVFAGRILVADEGSTDGSRAICAEFDKVTVIDAPADPWDEGRRWQLLVRAARELVAGPRLLLALQTDEILAANAMSTRGWQAMLAAKPKTVLRFEKPRLYLSAATSIRRPFDFAAGFVDDGASEAPLQRVHAARLPAPPGAPQMTVGEVKFLDYGLTRPQLQRARARMFAALENVLETKNLWERRRTYSAKSVLRPGGPTETTPPEWLTAWESRGIDMATIRDLQPYWQDEVTLDLLLEHGSRRFWYDPLWDKDWNRFIVQLGRLARVQPPPVLVRLALATVQRLLEAAR
jgi:hypothetical protein